MNPSFDPGQIPLRDIHLPDAIAWWPLAYGWWILGGLMLVAVTVLAVRYYAGRRHRAARKALRKAMDVLRAGGDPVLTAQRVSVTLRRFAMTVSDDADLVAGLAGESWVAFLDSRWERSDFTSGAGRYLLSAPYVAGGSLKREYCLELGLTCLAWVRAQAVRY